MKFNSLRHVLLIMLTLSCGEKQVDWEIQSDDQERLVVDAIITNELKPQEIFLSRTNQDMNLPSVPLSGAEVSVYTGSNRYDFIESGVIPGNYYSDPFQAVVGNTYRLIINFQDNQFVATAQTQSVSQLGEPAVFWDESKNLYRYYPESYGKPSMTEILYDWSEVEGYCNAYGSCMAQETFYVLDNIDVNAEFGPEKEIIFFPPGTKLLRRKYSLTNDHQQFIRSLLIETEWRGGIFDVLQGNIPSNLSNGALGYFAACSVVSDTTVIE